MDSPILLSADVALKQSESREPETTRLQNPFRTAMLIDEIRFVVTWGNFITPSLVRARLHLGRIPLTNGYVPIGNLGKILTDGDAVFGDGLLRFTWKLPKPLYVPPTELLIPSLYFATDFSGIDPVTVKVIYAGRSLASDFPQPKTINLPWAASFVLPPKTTPAGTDTTDESHETDLINPFNEPLRVQRFIGRFHDSRGADGPVFADLTSSRMLVRASDSEGRIMVRDSTPFSHLLSFLDRTWTVNTILKPKGFYLFQVDRNYAGYAAATNSQAVISMIGYREVQLQ